MLSRKQFKYHKTEICSFCANKEFHLNEMEAYLRGDSQLNIKSPLCFLKVRTTLRFIDQLRLFKKIDQTFWCGVEQSNYRPLVNESFKLNDLYKGWMKIMSSQYLRWSTVHNYQSNLIWENNEKFSRRTEANKYSEWKLFKGELLTFKTTLNPKHFKQLACECIYWWWEQ